MTNPTTSHENITPEMKAANHAICTLASVMRDCERCPFKPTKPTKPAYEMSKHIMVSIHAPNEGSDAPAETDTSE